MRDFFTTKPRLLWMLLSGFFITNTLVAEFMGVKLFSLEKTLGFAEANWTILGQPNLNFTLTAGVLLWPAVFIMTDIINEYYGRADAILPHRRFNSLWFCDVVFCNAARACRVLANGAY